jgi:hypothetical protein
VPKRPRGDVVMAPILAPTKHRRDMTDVMPGS